jgi:hypothetical protein
MSDMATTIPDQWPEIDVNILTPQAILRYQASQLKKKTRGLLDAELSVTTVGSKSSLQLDLIAPALNGYRHRVLAARFETEMVYPATVWADCYEPPAGSLVKGDYSQPQILSLLRAPEPNYREASSEREFLGIVAEVLRSKEVRALIDSLIARSNEQKPVQEPPAA